jgi:phospholipid/cholesterol/gamma-HCH transport system permease protein
MVGGDWRLSEPVPSWIGVLGKTGAASVRVVPQDLGKWDTSLVLFLVHGRAWCAQSKNEFHADGYRQICRRCSGKLRRQTGQNR